MDYIHIYDKNFPPLLKEIADAPIKLFFKGNIPNWNVYKILAVVGSRKYSTYGKNVCEKLIKGLAGYNVLIVSGLAYGIDTIAHKASIKNNIKTIAIPGSGLDKNVIYPRANVHLANEIIEKGGCLLSEFKPNQKASKFSFPKRNRIMAGIAHATLVIEAEKKSGSLITARLAVDYNRDLFVIPHDIGRKSGEGVNMFLQLGAYPVLSPNDIINHLKLKKINNKNTLNNKLDLSSPLEQQIINLLQRRPMSAEELAQKINKNISEITQALSLLELEGMLINDFGKYNLL